MVDLARVLKELHECNKDVQNFWNKAALSRSISLFLLAIHFEPPKNEICNKKCDFFIQEDVGYLLTPTSRLLLKDESNLSMIPFLQVELDPIMMDPWKYLSKWFQNGDFTPSLTVHGSTSLDTPRRNQSNRLFNKAIAN
ncbi:hypothetical protein HAX54_042745 [Datura stramonium]|uniref:Uncharacterized protein n=1 Tax=Datura stramonium TaxID=4076 RepID=A0ABS8SMQ1_DATST|nr:hypothetical protein [Datura stramonium]